MMSANSTHGAVADATSTSRLVAGRSGSDFPLSHLLSASDFNIVLAGDDAAGSTLADPDFLMHRVRGHTAVAGCFHRLPLRAIGLVCEGA